MGWERGWIGWSVACGCIVVAGCGSWTLRRQGTSMATPAAEQVASYAWEREGTFPAAPAVELEPTSSVAVAVEPAPTHDIPPSAGLHADTGFAVESLPGAAATLPVDTATDPGGEPGFQVQVFASRAHEAATAMRDELAAQWQEPVSLDFEAPYYKVRIGNCKSEAACSQLQQALRDAGYVSAFTVPARLVTP